MQNWISGIFALFLVSAAQARPADCLLIVDGAKKIDGVCDFTANADGLQVTSINGPLIFAQIDKADPAEINGYWNEEPGSNHAHSPLGRFQRDGACWVSDVARVCAWKIGEQRSYSVSTAERHPPPRDGGAISPPKMTAGDKAAFPESDIVQGCKWTYRATPALFPRCLEEEQLDFNFTFRAWTGLSDRAKAYCRSGMEKVENRFYGNLAYCVSAIR